MAPPEVMRMKNEQMILPPWTVDIMQRLRNHNTNTYRHSVRVGFIANALWRDLMPDKVKDSQFEIYPYELFLSGLVHDCGKLDISAEILNKRGKLNEDEQILIEKHPYTGAQMISKDSIVVADIIRGHHRFGKNDIEYPDYERDWDTQEAKKRDGYNIVEQAQIVLAVADKADVAINRIRGLNGVLINDESTLEFILRFQKEKRAGLLEENLLIILIRALQYAWDMGKAQKSWGDF